MTKVRNNAADPLMELLCVLSDVPITYAAIRNDLRAHGFGNNEAVKNGLAQLKVKYKLRLIHHEGDNGQATAVRVHPACMVRVREMGQGYWTGSRKQTVTA